LLSPFHRPVGSGPDLFFTGACLKTKNFSNDSEVQELVRAFEEKSITPKQFNHQAHVAIALSYLAQLPMEQALPRMRTYTQAFAHHHGHDGLYHETLTVFWMRLLEHLQQVYRVDQPLWQRINAIVTRWGNRRPVDAHYSPSVIKSAAARATWTEPDRLPLSF